MKQAFSPKGKKIVGIVEVVEAEASIHGFDEDGEPQYAGQSDVDWDTQSPDRDPDGFRTFVDEDGNYWNEGRCEFREVDDG